MRQLLHNKIVVACLVAVGVGLAAWRFLPMINGGLVDVSAREEEQSDQNEATPDDSSGSWTNRLRTSLELNAWRSSAMEADLKRDPFSYAEAQGAEGSGGNPADEEGAPRPPPLQLQAISSGGAQNLAVINRQVLAAGEQVDGYTVTSIEPDKVTLSGYGEVQVLTFVFDVPAPSSEPESPSSESPSPTKP